MFKRGDVVQGVAMHDDKVYLFVSANEAITIKGDTAYGHKLKPSLFCLQLYTGPIYEKAGQRFVASEEEVWVAPMSHPVKCKVLLPVPELEPEPEPEPEFEVGDWVKEDSGGFIYHINSFENDGTVNCDHCQISGQYFSSETFTKLPGRPLTTDDLMLNASGEEFTIHCNGCGCDGVVATIWPASHEGGVAFFHKGNTSPVATFAYGGIVFAGDVEGNIFVVEA